MLSVSKHMITRLFGPDIGNVQSLPDTGLVYIDDHIGHDEDFTGFDHLNQLLANSNCSVVIEYASAASVDPEFAHRVMCLPLQTYHTSYVMSRLCAQRPINNKYSVFNFALNKIRRNRQYLLQKLSAVQLLTHNYSVNWSTDARFPNKYFIGGESDKKANNINNGSWSNLDNFESYLRPAVYEPTWISIITEPGWQHSAAFFSEKTIFALEAQTIPLWFGGYGQAAWMQSAGFDVFEDIIDHSYQWHPNAQQRMDLAIDLNIEILCDQDRLSEFYAQNLQRFEHNRKLVRSNQWFYLHTQREMQRTQWSAEVVAQVFNELVIENNYQWPQNFGRVANIGLRATLIKS